jgi:hypothetical protein
MNRLGSKLDLRESEEGRTLGFDVDLEPKAAPALWYSRCKGSDGSLT